MRAAGAQSFFVYFVFLRNLFAYSFRSVERKHKFSRWAPDADARIMRASASAPRRASAAAAATTGLSRDHLEFSTTSGGAEFASTAKSGGRSRVWGSEIRGKHACFSDLCRQAAARSKCEFFDNFSRCSASRQTTQISRNFLRKSEPPKFLGKPPHLTHEFEDPR